MDDQPDGPSARAELAEEIKARIDRAGLGLERLAARLTSDGVQVSKSALSRYQRGEALPPRSVVIALASLETARAQRPNGAGLTELLELWCRAQGSTPQQPAHLDPAAEQAVADHDRLVPSAAELVAADALAERVRDQWERAAGNRRLLRPTPIPVRWRRSRRPVTGPVNEVIGEYGGLAELCAFFSGLSSGRIVILGRPGAGKSTVAILTLLAALEQRRRLDGVRRADVPVPVMLTTHGWDPRRQRLEDWVSDRLIDDYPVLRSAEFGRDAAARLMRAGQIALFLDGLDELADELRPVAIDAINRQPTNLRLVITTRDDTLADAVSGSHLHAATALELRPVPAGDAAEYLTRCQVDPPPAPWRRLIAHLREHPDSVLASALDSPLNLTLIRDTFPDPAEVDELLIPDRFGTRGEVEDILMDRIVPVAYQPVPGERPAPLNARQARQALGYLATRMNDRNTRDLAWWRMHHWASPVPRILVGGFLGLVASGLVGALVFGPAGQYAVKGVTGSRFGIVYGSGMGLLFGLVGGLVSEFREPGPRREDRTRSRLLGSARFNLAVGLLVGLAIGIAVGNQSHYAFGLPAGLLVGYAAGTAATRIPADSAGANQSRWRTVRSRIDVPTGCVAGLPVGLAYGLTKGLVHGLGAGIVSMFTVGLMIGFSRPTADSGTVTDPSTSWRRARRRGTAFGLAAGIPLGVGMGVANATRHGLFAGAVAAVGFGTVISLGGMAAVSDTWRTTLVFLQLRRHGIPLRGMHFLNDAYDRGVLRTAGPIYQFRHARLQDKLADRHDRPRPSR